ncbi:MAG: tRNA uridine-5-carboxymethylaminomethyl(34) synthesis GTPase MnmE [Gallionella sp.]
MQLKPDTIAAIATAAGQGGVGIIRISGRSASALAIALLGKLPPARYAHYCDFRDEQGELIDQGLAIFFNSPHSYTGEDVLELQGHGGTAVLQLLLQRCLSLGARLAEAGEFTRRAFLNNKIDLAQAEGVADLIEATTAQAARSAIRSLQGEFSRTIQNLVAELINLRMLVEAMLDFPEEDLDAIDTSRRDKQLSLISQQLNLTLASAQQGSLLREGARIALVGQPNVGKSSLLNCLAGEEIALVSDVPGTTRDVVRQEIQINGVPLHIMDTAGLRVSQDAVENMGMARTHQTMQKADLILLLCDAAQPNHAADKEILALLPKNLPVLRVYNKLDICRDRVVSDAPNEIAVSAKTGENIAALRLKILSLIGWRDMSSGAFMARERHLNALQQAQSHLRAAGEARDLAELFAEELRLAQAQLSSITGEFSPDDLLGEIFSRFCIGK